MTSIRRAPGACKGARRVLLACLGGIWIMSAAAARADEEQIRRGRYLVQAAGCLACHWDKKNKGAKFAGGRALKTPFGIYYSPNITPDKKTGIGRWSDEQFLAALWQGVRPDGSHYFPVFPYTSYTRIRRGDALAIKAYLFSLAPVAKAQRAHQAAAPFGWRWTVTFWKWLFFDAGRQREAPDRKEAWNRGRYLVRALAHCGECHSPRNALGAVNGDLFLAGTPDGPEGARAPNITPDKETGIGDWDEGDIIQLLKTGIKPDFDDVQGAMLEVIDDGLKHLAEADLKAIAVYLKSLPPRHNKVPSKQDK